MIEIKFKAPGVTDAPIGMDITMPGPGGVEKVIGKVTGWDKEEEEITAELNEEQLTEQELKAITSPIEKSNARSLMGDEGPYDEPDFLD